MYTLEATFFVPATPRSITAHIEAQRNEAAQRTVMRYREIELELFGISVLYERADQGRRLVLKVVGKPVRKIDFNERI